VGSPGPGGRWLLALGLAALALTGCAGASEFERCVDHSVEEGIARDVAEQGCERAVGRED
jgi:hypothetical protein